MAIYRFRITFEDYDEVIREIEVLPKHSFLDLHRAILEAVGFDPEHPSSFFISNDQWKKGEEFAYLPSESKIRKGVLLMDNTRLNQNIDDPHQKFYYTYNFERPFDFHVQLVKILEEDPAKKYPFLFKSIGKAPKIFNPLGGIQEATLGSSDDDVKNEFDFLNDMAYDSEEEDADLMDDEETETDEFSDQAGSDEDF
jgi:hypothetical protein